MGTLNIDFLTADEAADASFDVPDVYYAPGYAASAEIIDAGNWECAVADGGRYFFPYLRRPVPGSPDEYDIVTPYGYTAPVAPSGAERTQFLRAFRDKSRGRGLIAEFMRSHPFDIDEPVAAGLEVDRFRAHPTFTVDLREGVDHHWSAAEGRHRTAVRKAEKSGIAVAEADLAQLLDRGSSFRTLYDETMERVGSSNRLRLPTDYYERLINGVGPRSLALVEARLGGEIIASSIFLRWQDRLHYHLSGSTDAAMRYGATNAIIDHAARYLMDEPGMLHLGGGVRPGDGLERFKRSIGTIHTSVYLCQTVVNRARYKELVTEAGTDPDSEYFPAYRA